MERNDGEFREEFIEILSGLNEVCGILRDICEFLDKKFDELAGNLNIFRQIRFEQ